MRAILRRLGLPRRSVHAVNDALIALVAGADEDPGVVVIAGTGSIAYGVGPDAHGGARRRLGRGLRRRRLGVLGRRARAGGGGARRRPARPADRALGAGAAARRRRSHRRAGRARSSTGRIAGRRLRRWPDWWPGPTPTATPWRPRSCAAAADELALAARVGGGAAGDAGRALPRGAVGRAVQDGAGAGVDAGGARRRYRAAGRRPAVLTDEPALGAVRLARRAAEGRLRLPVYAAAPRGAAMTVDVLASTTPWPARARRRWPRRFATRRRSVLGLPTGRTPVGLYARCARAGLDWSRRAHLQPRRVRGAGAAATRAASARSWTSTCSRASTCGRRTSDSCAATRPTPAAECARYEPRDRRRRRDRPARARARRQRPHRVQRAGAGAAAPRRTWSRSHASTRRRQRRRLRRRRRRACRRGR